VFAVGVKGSDQRWRRRRTYGKSSGKAAKPKTEGQRTMERVMEYAKGIRGLSAALALCSFSALAEEPLAPPSGSKLLLEVGADGVQVYVCAAKDRGFAWNFDGPAASLFDPAGRQVGIHGKGPMWSLGDGSAITAELVAKQTSPQSDAIPWLLLKVNAHLGTNGQLTNAVFVRRIATKGGLEPSAGCDSAHQGDIARVRYSATYQFFD
jgi:hypothetical protein